MAKQKLLLVDADPRSLRVLDVSLRKAGYSVTASGDAMRALEMMDLSPPDLILSDTRLPGMDGFAFRQQVAMRDDWSTIPFMFLSSDTSVESKVRGLELGVEDYLTKPIYIKEIITRVNLVLSRKQREGIETRASLSKTQFTGSLADMGLVDLLQTIDISRKSGVLLLLSGTQRGALYFTDGRLIDAEVGPLKGEAAVYRALVWSDGTFTLDFRPVRRDETITAPMQGVLMEGMRRLDEWGRLLEQLPPLDSVFEVDETQLLEKLSEIPDEINAVLRLFDGRRSLLEVVDTAGADDLGTLMAVSKLYFEGLVFPTGRRTSEYPKREQEVGPEETAGAEDSLESDMVPGREPTGLTNRPPPTAAAAPVAIVPPVDLALPIIAAGAGDRAEANAGGTASVSGVPERADATTPDTPGIIAVSPTVTVGTGGAETQGPAAEAAPGNTLENDAASDDSDGDGAEGEAEMAKKRKKKSGRIEIPAVEAVESADNVIQFPAKTSARAVGGGAVAVGDGVSSSHVSNDSERAESEPPARESTAKVTTRAKDDADAKKDEPKPVEAEAKKEEPKAEAKKEEPKAEEKSAEGKKDPEAAAKNVTERDEKADSSDDWKERKRKKQRTTSSQTLSAQGAITITGEHPAMADEFFNAPTYEATRSGPHTEHETWEDLKEPAEPTDTRMASGRVWTIGILVAAAIGIGGFVLYQKVIMPQPATLGGPTIPATLPTPIGPNGQPMIGPAAGERPAVGTQFVTGEPTTPATGEPGGEPAAATGEPGGEPAAATGEPGGEPAAATGEPGGQVATGEQPAAPATGEQPAAPATGEQPAAPATGEQPAAPAAATGDYDTLLAQALAAARRNRTRDAIPLFEQAIAANPNGSAAMSGLAMLNLNRNKMQDAADLANRAVAADPTNAEGWIVLGAARDALHDRAGSREAYRQCVERGRGRYVAECRAMR